MYHKIKKESSHLRAAVYKSYKGKCAYCGRTIQERDMHIDHIIPSNAGKIDDVEIKQYILELEKNGFEVDSVENYLPSCPACNIAKSNKLFTASNLRYFHEQARYHRDDILEKIEKLKLAKETFYEPVNTEMWEKLDFTYQRDLSHAIMGYRLTPADVESCPRFKQVESVKKQLAIVDYVVVEGETGCGKSISLYQTAYDFYKEGWEVYCCKVGENTIVPVIPSNTELSLYLIDDAQRFSENIIDIVKKQARSNTKIIFAKTISSSINHDTILLTNQDAVNLMYNEFLQRKKEVVAVVQKCDNSIGVNCWDQPIEFRLGIAKDAHTPWQFNYILRGGWRTMEEQYKSICKHNHCDLLAAAIATFQIMKLDNNVDYRRLCAYLSEFDDSLSWNEEDLKYLVEKKIILSEDDIRIVHMESANVIIALFIQSNEEEKKKVLYKAIEDSLVKKRISPLGIVWLCNGIRRYLFTYDYEKKIITEKMIEGILENLNDIQCSEERKEIAYFIEKVFDMSYEKNGEYYFQKNQKIFLQWIESADSKTAYAYSRLLNVLRNSDIKQHRKFVEKLDWVRVQESMLKELNPNLYAWGELFNRLICSFTKKKYLELGKELENTIKKVCEKGTVGNIEGVSSFLCSIAYTNSEYIHFSIEKLLPIYKTYFENDMLKAIYLFDFDFLLYICGLSLLGGHRATPIEKKSAKELVSILPVEKFANMIIESQPRDWHTIQPVMCLVACYDKKKANQIVNLIDLDKLSETAKDSWGHSHEITELCDIIYMGNSSKAREFIRNNEKRINVMYSSLTMYAPKCAINAFEKGINIDLLTEHWWHVSLHALNGLIKVDLQIAKEVLRENIPQIIERINNITALEFNEEYCLKFLRLIKKCDSEIFRMIIVDLDGTKICSNWNKGAIYPQNKMKVEKRRKEFFDLIEI